MFKTKKHHIGAAKRDTSRFLTLEAHVCREFSWYETLGALTFGSAIVPTLPQPKSEGLRGDINAIAGDYRRVGRRLGGPTRFAKAS